MHQAGDRVKEVQQRVGMARSSHKPSDHPMIKSHMAEGTKKPGDMGHGSHQESAPTQGPSSSGGSSGEGSQQPVAEEAPMLRELDLVSITGYIKGGALHAINFTTWDFAGQKQFYALFHVFLTR